MSKLPYKDRFIPKNPQKYMGQNLHSIYYRSSWEHTMMMTLDNHPDVIAWQSEAIGIFYVNPFTKQTKPYIPDFIVVYRDQKSSQQIVEMIEIKPKDEMPGYRPALREKISRLKQGKQVLNAAKWKAAMTFCTRRGWRFRVACEDQLFAMRRYTRGRV
jgi:hypothetical protein